MGADGFDAIVVGAGVNGLTAAARLTRAGRRVLVVEAASSIGGSAATAELLVPGVRHDIGAAVVPFAAASPAFRELRLDLPLRFGSVEFAHPLPSGRTVQVVRSLDDTAAQFGSDERSYRTLLQRFVGRFDALVDDAMAPQLKIPAHPLLMARFGPQALRSAKSLGRGFDGAEGQALLAGLGAHATVPPDRVLTGGIGLLLLAAAHAVGWPVVEGGTQTVSEALARVVIEGGGEVRLDAMVTRLDDLPAARPVLFDVTPGQFAAIVPEGAAAFRRWRYGPGACKVDYVLSGAMPWTDPACRATPTLHLGGDAGAIIAAEREVAAGRYPDSPFVIVTQPHIADPSRQVDGRLPLWAYCHVPNGSTVDVSASVEAQIDRYAPGWRDLIVAKRVVTAEASERLNRNRVGGDLAGGAMSFRQVVFGPRPGRSPYRTNVRGVYLCSSALPPGAGVHGMSGWHAAGAALNDYAGR
jgi:phytoene dehydrogenase-like protein